MQQNESYYNKALRLAELLCAKDVKSGIMGKDSVGTFMEQQHGGRPLQLYQH